MKLSNCAISDPSTHASRINLGVRQVNSLLLQFYDDLFAFTPIAVSGMEARDEEAIDDDCHHGQLLHQRDSACRIDKKR